MVFSPCKSDWRGIFILLLVISTQKGVKKKKVLQTSFLHMKHEIKCGHCVHIRFTFFPIPLVGEGAGDTGTKSIRFGDEDADFSKSLSLWTQHKEKLKVISEQTYEHVFVILRVQRLWEYYTTNSVWAWTTAGPDNSQNVWMLVWHAFTWPLYCHREAKKMALGQNMHVQNTTGFTGRVQNTTDQKREEFGQVGRLFFLFVFTRLRLSSQEWLICMAAWTPLCA